MTANTFDFCSLADVTCFAQVFSPLFVEFNMSPSTPGGMLSASCLYSSSLLFRYVLLHDAHCITFDCLIFLSTWHTQHIGFALDYFQAFFQKSHYWDMLPYLKYVCVQLRWIYNMSMHQAYQFSFLLVIQQLVKVSFPVISVTTSAYKFSTERVNIVVH